MTTLNANFPAMQQAVDDIRSCHNALVREKEGLEQFLTKLDSTWQGSTAGQWVTVRGQWYTACDDVNGILLNLYNALEQALHNYRGTEHYLEQLWGGH